MKKRVLIIAPHPDDETLGLGGSIAKMIDNGYEIFVLTIAGHLPPLYPKGTYEVITDEAYRAYDILGIKNSKFLEIPSTMIGNEPIHELNSKINSVSKKWGRKCGRQCGKYRGFTYICFIPYWKNSRYPQTSFCTFYSHQQRRIYSL